MSESVLLIQPPTVQAYRGKFARTNSLPPLGLLYIGSLLEKRGHHVRLVDFLVEELTREEFVEMLLEVRPAMVGLSVYAESYRFAKELAGVTKATLPDCLVVFGGAFATFAYEEVLSDRNVDYVVRFEGERTVEELFERLENGQSKPGHGIAGVAHRDNGGIVAGALRPWIRDLDSLPIPNRDLVQRDRYTWAFSIMTARGCPAHCTYCCAGAFWHGIRFRRVDKIIEEIAHLQQRYDMEAFYIADDTFTSSPRRVLDFCDRLRSAGHQFTWACESRVDSVNQPMLERMYACGCRRLQFGVESGVQAILDAVRKGTTIAQIEEAVSLAHKVGFFTIISFILGHPQDTLETMRQTLDFVEMLQEKYGAYVLAAVNTPLPGTYQFEHADELGLRIHSRNWDDYVLCHPNVSTENFTVEDLGRMYTEAVAGKLSKVNAKILMGTMTQTQIAS